ncbi:hypothetical protein [Kitasatospora sp. NPDC001547]|uniref:hypothetical protein n=1 Tax=Kitasatospora sp. NPDC001547 TaxID=3364015 RepID=UPI0036B64A1A|nr:hypothetical protein KitaXyl93_06400 [Kitasatospora sp. Xyl93]
MKNGITCLPTGEGWYYLACRLDLATREVVGYAMADHHRARLVVDALPTAHGRGCEEAAARRRMEAAAPGAARVPRYRGGFAWGGVFTSHVLEKASLYLPREPRGRRGPDDGGRARTVRTVAT